MLDEVSDKDAANIWFIDVSDVLEMTVADINQNQAAGVSPVKQAVLFH